MKTLKDMKNSLCDSCGNKEEPFCDGYNNLKQEVINIIKSMDASSEEVLKEWKQFVPKTGDIIMSMATIKLFMKYFFNISEEDLE